MFHVFHVFSVKNYRKLHFHINRKEGAEEKLPCEFVGGSNCGKSGGGAHSAVAARKDSISLHSITF